MYNLWCVHSTVYGLNSESGEMVDPARLVLLHTLYGRRISWWPTVYVIRCRLVGFLWPPLRFPNYYRSNALISNPAYTSGTYAITKRLKFCLFISRQSLWRERDKYFPQWIVRWWSNKCWVTLYVRRLQ